ncbi:MAG: hypothetical protein U5L96_09040 [Owenweeksia sp.]|nr:hypothetical protein [Owenweeksia sp.]
MRSLQVPDAWSCLPKLISCKQSVDPVGLFFTLFPFLEPLAPQPAIRVYFSSCTGIVYNLAILIYPLKDASVKIDT